MEKSSKNYVCGVCFHRVEDCTCEVAPWELIGIDYEIQYAIRTLNTKGYMTHMSCAGHYNGKNNPVQGYITLRDKVPNAPMGWTERTYTRRLDYFFVPKDKTEYKQMLKEKIEALNEWVDAL